MLESNAITDVVELCTILQCLGFTVKSLDTSDGNLSQDGATQQGVTRTVVINCQESGSTLLGNLPKAHRERITKELRELVRCIKENNESDVYIEEPQEKNKSASMVEIGTPEKRHFQHNLKVETPTRYRSLDALTSAKDDPEPPLPAPRLLQKQVGPDQKERSNKMCHRQSTYTISSTPGSAKRRNKTSSPIRAPQTSVLDSLKEAEKIAEDLKNKLAGVIKEFAEESKNDSSISSLVLDVSKISVLKGETSKAQFASSPNLSGLGSIREDFTNTRLKRFESVSTSNLNKQTPPNKDGRVSKLKRLSPNFFQLKKDGPRGKEEKTDVKNKLQSLFKPRIVTPVRIPQLNRDASPNLSAKKKFSHVKSTIPRPTPKKE